MFKYIVPILCLLVALGLSICTGYISVVGLMYIFSGIWIPFALVETAKLVVTVVLHKHWNDGFGILKSALIGTVIISMLITSMGVFGYLSKSSSSQKETVTINSSKLESIEHTIERKQSIVDKNSKQIDKYNDMLARLITDNPTKASKERKSIQSSIKSLEQDNKSLTIEIDKLVEESLPYKKEVSKHEVEIGSLLYITKLLYKDDYKNHAEDALTYLILSIMFVLDPLAIMMLIASQKSFEKISSPKRKIKVIRRKNEKPEQQEQLKELKEDPPKEVGQESPIDQQVTPLEKYFYGEKPIDEFMFPSQELEMKQKMLTQK